MINKKLSYPKQVPLLMLQKNFSMIITTTLCISCAISPVKTLGDTSDFMLSFEEKESLNKFRESIKDLLAEDFMNTNQYLIRWFRVAHFNIPTAHRLLMKTVAWRATNNISQILSEDFSDLTENVPINYGGYDKEGRPKLMVNEWDLRKIAIQGTQYRLKRYLEYLNEKSFQSILSVQRKSGKPVARAVFIINAEGVNFQQHICPICLPPMMQWTTSLNTHYPFIVAEIIIINASPIISVALKNIRPLISTDMLNRLKIFDTHKQRWTNYLDKRIDKNQRTKPFAGSKTI